MENQKLWLLQRIYCNDVTPIVIKEGLYKIGRSPESNILCKSEWVSRFHCDVTVRDGLVYIRDLGSLNGTFIEETEIFKKRDIQLKHGDVISLGKPFTGGEPEAGHYVYKLMACSAPQESKNRKRKASASRPDENKRCSLSPKRRRALSSLEKCRVETDEPLGDQQRRTSQVSIEQGTISTQGKKDLTSTVPSPANPSNGNSVVSSSDKILQCIDLTADEILPEAGNASPDSSDVNDVVPLDFNVSSTTPYEEKIYNAVMKLLQSSDSKNVFKTIKMLSEEVNSREERVQMGKTVVSCSAVGNNSSRSVKEEHYDGILNSNLITSSSASISAMDIESTSFHSVDNFKSSLKQISHDNEEGLNINLREHEDNNVDQNIECGSNRPKIPNKPDLIQPPNSKIEGLKNESLNLHDEVISNGCQLMRSKIVVEKHDRLLSNEPKEQDYLPQLKTLRSNYFKSDLKNTDDHLKNSNSKKIEISLISNKNELCGSRTIDNITENLGGQYKSDNVSLCGKEKILSEDTCIVYPRAESKNDRCKVSPQVKDNPIDNMKQDIACNNNDAEEEMVFSQDADGVVVIDLSEDELEYSQLFMEQDEVDKELTNEKSSVIVKEELFYDIVDDNEDIELFKAHFSQCTQEQEMIMKAETSKKKVKSPSHSSSDENSTKELHRTEKGIHVEGIDKQKVQDIRIKLKRLDPEPYIQSNEKMAEEHSISDEKFSHVSKQTELNIKTCESTKHENDELEVPKQFPNSLEVIDLHKLEIIKFNNGTKSKKESFDILKKDESNEVSADNKMSKSCGSGLGKIKTFVPNHTKLMESNKDTIDIKKTKPVKESVGVRSKSLAPNRLTDSSKIKKSTKKENSSDVNVTKTVEPRESIDICINKTVESEILSLEANKEAKIPPSDTMSGAKLVKSTLLSKPPIEKKKPGRPRKKETSVTKESLKKQKQKKIVEDRKAKLKSIALDAKSKVKDSVRNIVKHKETVTQSLDKEVPKNSTTVNANQHQEKICAKEILSDKYEPSIEVISSDNKFTVQSGSSNNKTEENLARSNQVAKVTERNRSSILLEGLLEAPDIRRPRIKRKLQTGNNAVAIIEPMSTRLSSGVKNSAGCSSKGEEVSVAKTEKSKSCLKIVGAPKSNKKVTFKPTPNVKTFICDGVLVKSVNAMSSKDKAPSILPMGKSAPVVTTLEETYFDVVHWNASWVNEIKVVPGEPPVYEEKYNAKDSYVSYKDYKRWLYPLMVYELWGNMCKTMVDEDANKTIRVFDGIVLDCLHYEAHATNGKNLLILKCFFPLYGKQAQSIVDPMDILLIKAQSTCNGQRICFVLFGLVYSSVMFSSHRETSDPIARHYLSTLNKQPDVCTYFDVIIYKSQKKQMSTGFQLRIRPLYNMMTELRQFESLIKLASSPLSDIIIDPVKNNSIYLQKDLNNKIISQYPLNAEQQNAILCSSQSVFANKPSISLIHGPPGTGKTQVIVAIIEQLLYRFKLKNNSKRKKILICSQSNAAVDEICLRLLDVRKELPREKRFKLTRFGRKEKIHPRVLEIQTATLARKEVEKRNLNDDFVLELSLQKATERMVATALENSSSPNIENYRKKYEKIQQIISSLEAIVNNTSSKETRSKEIERLVFDEEMKVIYHSDIIATTLGSCSHRKITKALNELSRPDERREVGVCIIDEATQATEADILMPLVYDVKNFILVGDPQQLPPYVVSPTAKKCGLGQSLFSRLYKVWSDKPSAPLYLLTAQHRMHPEIAHFPSKTFYNGLLTTPSFLAIKRPFKPYAVITHQFTQDSGSSETNVQEAGMIFATAERLLLEPEMKGLSIGLIVPYQRQRSLILELIHDKKLIKQLTVNTIDSYQGQEKDIILLSCVRTSGVGFLNDYQRINVALTRARKAMYIIANFVSLESTNVWKDLLADARERNLHLDLGQSGKVEDIFDFIFERRNKKSRTSSS